MICGSKLNVKSKIKRLSFSWCLLLRLLLISMQNFYFLRLSFQFCKWTAHLTLRCCQTNIEYYIIYMCIHQICRLLQNKHTAERYLLKWWMRIIKLLMYVHVYTSYSIWCHRLVYSHSLWTSIVTWVGRSQIRWILTDDTCVDFDVKNVKFWKKFSLEMFSEII